MARYDKNEGDRTVVEVLVNLSKNKAELAAALGVSGVSVAKNKTEIAAEVGVSVYVLEKYYPDELARLKPSHPNDTARMVVRRMSELGYTPGRIAAQMRLSVQSLNEHYANELVAPDIEKMARVIEQGEG